VRRALAPRYLVEREIGRGGIGVVFVARDPRLDRLVAVKVLKPDRFTAQTEQRFRREAKLHAQVQGPNILPIHDGGEADGLSYYVMDYIEGETLAERLNRGSMRPRAVRALGRALLAALAGAHAKAIIHRAVKPSNVFVAPRVLLADFGIEWSNDDDALADDGLAVRIHGYIPREQRNGVALPESDLYAVSAVLYEALTGRHWQPIEHPERGDWSKVPRRLARVLQRGLADAPRDRWPTAQSFSAALQDPTFERELPQVLGVLAVGLITGLLLKALLRAPPAPPPVVDFALAPFTNGLASSSTGRDVARYAADPLEWYPAWSIRPTGTTFAWWDSTPPGTRSVAAFARLRTRRYIEGEIISRPEGSVLHLALRDSAGALLDLVDVPGSATDPIAWGRAVADSIVRRSYPGQLEDYRRAVRLSSTSVPAYREFFRGQEAFQEDNWVAAEAHYQRALALDPAFAHAAWELALVRWWRRDSAPAAVMRDLYVNHRDELPGLQRLLTEGLLEPDPERRLVLFARAVQQYPASGDGLLLFGNELFTRGPLVGIPVDSGVRVFEASTKRKVFATAFMHAALGHIRVGDRQAAHRDIRSLPQPSDSADSDAKLRRQLLTFAFDERFETWRTRLEEAMIGFIRNPAILGGVRQYARFGSVFDIPRAQLVLGRLLARRGLDNATRAGGYEAQGLASMLVGRPAAALAQLDSAAVLFGTPEARLQRAQWRVLMAPLGLGTPTETDLDEARTALLSLAEGGLGSRAAWTLAVAAGERGDSAEAARWADRLAGDARSKAEAGDLHQLLLARAAAQRGLLDSAVTIARPLLHYDERGLGADPFARALLHLELGDWLARQGDPQGAERVWLWTEAWDITGWAEREAQAGEVDVAVGAVARLRRGRLALAQRDPAFGCRHLERVRELWTGAEPMLASARALADSLAGACQ
jgi:tetratricopeptide (TPR) repeat protein